MSRFDVGEEVLYDEEVYTVSAVTDSPPYRYRLLASRPDGARFVWAEEDELSRMEPYLRSRDDTRNY